MPRRKQQAPRRASAYVPEELKEAALLDEDVDGDDSAIEEETGVKFVCQDKDFLLKDSPAADFSSHEMDSESHVSESSDRMSDFESASVKNEEDSMAKEPLNSMTSTSSMMMATAAAAAAAASNLSVEEAALSGPNSLEQMKAIYNSFLTSSYWSSLNLNLTQPPPEKPARSHSSSSSSSSTIPRQQAACRTSGTCSSGSPAPPGKREACERPHGALGQGVRGPAV